MDIFINMLQGKTKMIAERIDKCGNDNNKIDMKEEVSLFKSVLAEKVREGKMSEFEYISIFGRSSFMDFSLASNVDQFGYISRQSKENSKEYYTRPTDTKKTLVFLYDDIPEDKNGRYACYGEDGWGNDDDAHVEIIDKNGKYAVADFTNKDTYMRRGQIKK